MRLLADHALAAHLLHLAVGIGDDPVARHQACRHLALVADGDGVGEHEALLARVGLVARGSWSRRRRNVCVACWRSWALRMAARDAHRQHVAGRGVQHGVLGEVDEDRQAVTLAAAEHDRGRLAVSRATRTISALTLPDLDPQAAAARPSSAGSAASRSPRAPISSSSICTAASASRRSARPARTRPRAAAELGAERAASARAPPADGELSA